MNKLNQQKCKEIYIQFIRKLFNILVNKNLYLVNQSRINLNDEQSTSTPFNTYINSNVVQSTPVNQINKNNKNKKNVIEKLREMFKNKKIAIDAITTLLSTGKYEKLNIKVRNITNNPFNNF